MNLSKLQKYILLQGFNRKNRLDRKVLLDFYHLAQNKPTQQIMVNSITSSLERLIKKGLIVGFGEITKEKIFIKKIQLTRQGIATAKKCLGEQKKLPFKLKLKKS